MKRKEELGLMEAWLENEREMEPLLEKLMPLMKKRLELEKALPSLVALRDPLSTGLPVPKKTTFPQVIGPPPSKNTILVDTGEPLRGDPPRQVPKMEEFQRIVDKRTKANKRKRENEKKRVKNAKVHLGKASPEKSEEKNLEEEF
jgi:hypothetical protein